MQRLLWFLAPVVLLALLVFSWQRWTTRDALYRQGIRGPAEATPVPESFPRTPVTAYGDGEEGADVHALALWVLDPTSSWLGLVHGFKAMGVPVRVVTTPDEALKHDVVVAYPTLTGVNASSETLERLAAHVARGGTLVAFAVLAGGMPEVFGFREAHESKGHREIRLLGGLGWRPEVEEARIPLAGGPVNYPGLPGVRYLDPLEAPVAVYEDGSPAVVHKAHPRGGHAYAVGFDFGHYMLRARNNRFTGLTDNYANGYQPVLDGVLRWLREVYRAGEPDAVTLHSVPRGRAFTALMTHDIDFTRSMDNVAAYAALETRLGIPATYFIQTKYVRDYNDDIFIDASRIPQMKALAHGGFEVASHSVAHSHAFKDFPLGSGEEVYPGYKPFVTGSDTYRGGTVMGELRVSKYMLEALSGARVESFRPGHLSLPPRLPEALEAAGYRYSSSVSANDVLTHFPYRMMRGRSYASESEIYEFPVTIEDEEGRLGDRFDAAVALARRIARHGGVVNVLIHTDVTDHKLEFEERFFKAFKDEAWFGTMSAFGGWWAARDRARTTVTSPRPDARVLTVRSPRALGGLAFDVPRGWKLDPAVRGATQTGSRVLIDTLPAGSTVSLPFSL